MRLCHGAPLRRPARRRRRRGRPPRTSRAPRRGRGSRERVDAVGQPREHRRQQQRRDVRRTQHLGIAFGSGHTAVVTLLPPTSSSTGASAGRRVRTAIRTPGSVSLIASRALVGRFALPAPRNRCLPTPPTGRSRCGAADPEHRRARLRARPDHARPGARRAHAASSTPTRAASPGRSRATCSPPRSSRRSSAGSATCSASAACSSSRSASSRPARWSRPSATRSSVVVAGRVLQGVGGGIFPLCFGIIRDEFPRERVAAASA